MHRDATSSVATRYEGFSRPVERPKPLIALFIYTWIAAGILLLLAGRLRVLARGTIRS